MHPLHAHCMAMVMKFEPAEPPTTKGNWVSVEAPTQRRTPRGPSPTSVTDVLNNVIEKAPVANEVDREKIKQDILNILQISKKYPQLNIVKDYIDKRKIPRQRSKGYGPNSFIRFIGVISIHHGQSQKYPMRFWTQLIARVNLGGRGLSV